MTRLAQFDSMSELQHDFSDIKRILTFKSLRTPGTVFS